MEDVRQTVTITPPELPWPLHFHYLHVTEDNGEERWANVGIDFGRPVARDELASLDPDRTEIGQEHLAVLWEHLMQYRRLAEDLLIADRSAARRTRAAMARPSGNKLDPAYLALLAAEYRMQRGARGAIYDIADRRGITRQTVWRQLRRAVKLGLLDEGELPAARRSREATR